MTWKVGERVVAGSYRGAVRFETVKRVTPSGQVVTNRGRYTAKGVAMPRSSHIFARRILPSTKELVERATRTELADRLKRELAVLSHDLHKLPGGELEALSAAVKAAQEKLK